MRHFISILAILFFAVTMLFGQQTLTLVDDTVEVIGTADEVEIVATGTIYNNTSSPVSVSWIRTRNDLQTGWEGSLICDGNQCYTKEVNAAPLPFTIDPNKSSNFDVHFEPANVPGNGEVQLVAYVVGDSANTVVTGVYKATAEEPTGLGATSSFNDGIKIYPNPVRDYMLIRNLPANTPSIVEVYNIFGKRMMSFVNAPSNNASSVQRFNVESLPKGIYMIRIYDHMMNVIQTKSISKIK